MAKLLAHYKNGNYDVILLEDGTKIRYNKLDNLTHLLQKVLTAPLQQSVMGVV